MLTEKAQQQERTIEDLAAKEVDFGKTQIELDNLKNQIESLTKAQESLTEEKDHMQKVCKQHQEEICQLQEDKEYLIGILSDATSVIKTALDVSLQVSLNFFYFFSAPDLTKIFYRSLNQVWEQTHQAFLVGTKV